MAPGRFMWGSDYPHDEGTPPFTRETLRAVFHSTPEDELRDVLAGNAARLYDFDLDALAPLAAQYGPTAAEIASPLVELPERPNAALLKAAASPRAV
jgi:predicted TIM-barrel fold metal-dependent hydrolase